MARGGNQAMRSARGVSWPRSLTAQQRADIVARYLDDEPLGRIAEDYGVSAPDVAAWISSAGVARPARRQDALTAGGAALKEAIGDQLGTVFAAGHPLQIGEISRRLAAVGVFARTGHLLRAALDSLMDDGGLFKVVAPWAVYWPAFGRFGPGSYYMTAELYEQHRAGRVDLVDDTRVAEACQRAHQALAREHPHDWQRHYEVELTRLRGADPREVMGMAVQDLDLGVRTSHVLGQHGIHTVGDLVGLCREDLRQFHGFGQGMWQQVRAGLLTVGIELPDSPRASASTRAATPHRRQIVPPALGENA